MNLSKKKNLAAKTLKVGKGRISFVKSRLDEIKEIITKQDVKDLAAEGAIKIKAIQGKKKVQKKGKRSPGNVRKKVNKRKQEYVKLTRKLRKNARGKKVSGEISREEEKEIRKKIRNRTFKSNANLKDYIRSLKK
jgi:ribosomal protein L19E